MIKRELKITGPLPPSVNSYLGKKVAFKNGKPYVMLYETKEAKQYKGVIARLVHKSLGLDTLGSIDNNTYVICEIELYIPKKRRDADNCFKVLLDALGSTDIVYDDCMFIPRVKNIFIDPSNPRAVIKLKVANKIGVFSEETYKIFIEKNCSKCSKNSQKCSFLKKSRENRIIPEINLNELNCKKVKCKN